MVILVPCILVVSDRGIVDVYAVVGLYDVRGSTHVDHLQLHSSEDEREETIGHEEHTSVDDGVGIYHHDCF